MGSLIELTPREREVASLVADGFSNVAISKRFCLSIGSIKNYVRSIIDKPIPEGSDRHEVSARVLVAKAVLENRYSALATSLSMWALTEREVEEHVAKLDSWWADLDLGIKGKVRALVSEVLLPDRSHLPMQYAEEIEEGSHTTTISGHIEYIETLSGETL